MSYEAWKVGYKSLWEAMVVGKVKEAGKQARDILAVRGRYETVETSTGVPWFVIGICHVREAGDPPDFKAVLHNGERIVGTGKKTRLVPKNRGPFGSWFEAAVDAVNIEHLNGVNWKDGWGPEHVAYFLEVFNGTGYRGHGIPSPYLWGGTSVQQRGKFIQDGVYDKNTMDPQVGGMAILRELMLLDPSISFSATPGAQFPKPGSPTAPVSVPPPLANEPTSSSPVPQHPPQSSSESSTSPPVPSRLKPSHGLAVVLGSLGIWFHEYWPYLLAGLAVAGVGYGLYKWRQSKSQGNLSPKALDPTGEIAVLEPTTLGSQPDPTEPQTSNDTHTETSTIASEGTPPIA